MRKSLALAFVIGALTATLAAQQLQRVNPDGLSKPTTYTHVVRAGTLLFIAGQVGAKADNALAGPGMAAQLEQALQNLQIALVSQGANFSHVAKITIYTTSVAEYRAPEVAEVRAKYFGVNRPASTLVQISQLANPDYKVEIEAIAVLPSAVTVRPVR